MKRVEMNKSGNGIFDNLNRRDLLAGGTTFVAAGTIGLAPSSAFAGLSVVEIAPGVYVHQGRHELTAPGNHGDICNCGFIVGAKSVAVIDTGGSIGVGRALRSAIKALTALPVSAVINTHMHPDHVLGNAAFKPEAPAFVGHHKLARALGARAERYLAMARAQLSETDFAGTEIVAPTVAVEATHTVDLGGRTLTLTAHRTAHTDNDLTVRDNATGTVFMGDLVFSGHVPTLDGSIKGWLSLAEKLAAEPADRIVPGHGPPSMPWPDAIRPVQHYFEAIASDVRAMIKSGKTLAEASTTAALSEKDKWQLFNEFHVRNVSAAFAELEWE